MTTLLILIVGTLNIVCFYIGAKVGQQVSKGETITTPNPVKAIEERKERKVAKEEQGKIDAILRNIEKYNGTELGQEDVPK
jgi:hypothetical protein